MAFQSHWIPVVEKIYLVFCSVTDPDPRSGAFLTPGSGFRDGYPGNKLDPDPGSRSGMNNPDHISDSLETIFFVKIQYLNSLMDPCPGWKKFGSWIRDPGWKKFGSATLVFLYRNRLVYPIFV